MFLNCATRLGRQITHKFCVFCFPIRFVVLPHPRLKQATRLYTGNAKIFPYAVSHSKAQPKMEDYASRIKSYLDGNSDVQETVKGIIKPIASQLSKSSEQDAPNDQLYALWTSVLDAAQAIPKPYDIGNSVTISETTQTTLGKLRNLLDAIRAVPNLFPDQSKSVTEQIAKLPDFGMTVRDRFNPPQSGSSESWADLNAFLAVLWKSCDPSSDYTKPEAYDYGLYSIWSLRDTLETEQGSEQLKVLLPAAAAWILISGEIISKTQRKFPASPKTGAPARAGPLLTETLKQQSVDPKDIEGFSRVRWEFWKSSFEKIAGNGDVDKEVRAIAKAAFEQMENY